MQHSLKTDFALFTAAFLAVALVLGANADFAEIVGFIVNLR
jgi:hypothetical protein